MKITRIEPKTLSKGPLVQLLVTVTTEDGASGTGECWWGVPDAKRPVSPYVATLEDVIAPRFIGQDATRIEELWQEVTTWAYRYGDEGILSGALSGIDLALWDLKGRVLGVSVLDLLGGPAVSSLSAYASLPPLRKPGLLLREIGRAVDHGFRAVKLHELDPGLAELVRGEFGDDLGIMVDVGGHYDPAEAVAAGRRLQACDVIWLEEPTRPMRDHAAMARVRREVAIPLAAGENEYSLDAFQRLIESNAVDYVQPEITKIGGLTQARRISALVEAASLTLCPHNFRLGPAFDACLHWGFSSPATKWIEVPWLPESLAFPSGDAVPGLVDGALTPPAGPGLAR